MSFKSYIKRKFFTKILNVSLSHVTPLNELHGRCALITGGTSGIGYSIAQAFLQAGASVIITGRDNQRIKVAVGNLKSLAFKDCYVDGIVLHNDVPSEFEEKFAEIVRIAKHNGRPSIDILVNNAGVNGLRMPNAVEEEYDRILDTNLKGTFFLSQMVGKYFVTNGIKGNVLNIGSASGLRPADSAYTLSKWGIRGLTMGLAKSLGKYGITVNSIAPGPTATPMMHVNNESNMYLERIPLGRYILPEEIAKMAVVLVSDLGRSIMGDTIYMTGGAGLLTFDDVEYGF